MGFRDFVRLARELISAGGPEMVATTLLRQADDLAEKAEKLLATTRPLFTNEELAAAGTEAAQLGAAPAPPATPEEVERKIDEIYGTRATSEVVWFVIHAPGATRVAVAGDFNNWSPEATPLLRNGRPDCFHTLLPLQSGRYCYRFVVDGQWKQDPSNAYVEANPFGELNSIVEVP
jgi:hypothetical protein